MTHINVKDFINEGTSKMLQLVQRENQRTDRPPPRPMEWISNRCSCGFEGISCLPSRHFICCVQIGITCIAISCVQLDRVAK